MSHLKTDEKMTYVLIWIGEEGLRIYNTWNNDSKTLTTFWNHLSEVLEPRSNYRLARMQIEKIRQSKDEPIDEFMTKCMLQAKKCKFRDETEIETRLIEQIIRGGAHDKVREDILCKDNTLTLDQAMKIARIYELLQSELKEFKAGSNTHIDHVSNILSDNKHKTAYRKTNNHLDKSHNDKITNLYVTCKYCGLKHTGVDFVTKLVTGLRCVAKNLNHFLPSTIIIQVTLENTIADTTANTTADPTAHTTADTTAHTTARSTS